MRAEEGEPGNEASVIHVSELLCTCEKKKKCQFLFDVSLGTPLSCRESIMS